MLEFMRFYIHPVEKGKAACINFDHVRTIMIDGPSIEIHFAGSETPLTLAKSPTTLALIGKGMDLSDSSKEQINNL